MKSSSNTTAMILLVAALGIAAVMPTFGDKQSYTALTNSQTLAMLNQIEKDIKENYYDPSLHGVDVEKRFAEARGRIATAKSQDEALLQIAGAVGVLDDSHTRFAPPDRPYQVDYGFLMQAVGDSACYVTAVLPGSDAETKGLKPGDQILAINGVPIVRQDINIVEFGYRVFPQSGLHLDVRSPQGTQRSFVAMAKVTAGQKIISRSDIINWKRAHPSQEYFDRAAGQGNRSQFYETDKKVLFWKLPSFMIDPPDLEGQTSNARSFPYVVLDLRGNLGGRVDALKTFLGEFFDHDVTLGNEKGRKGLKPIIVKGRGKNAIDGKLIVLIDSKSASAAEIFARTIQLEKRGTVLGDRSSGRVMESRSFVHAVSLGQENVTEYGTSITVEDIILSDGTSLEKVGVMPDERIVPTPADLAAGRDPVLVRAAELAGEAISPEKAGKLFPFQWPDKPVEID